MECYEMAYASIHEGYIRFPADAFGDIRDACARSEFQHLSREPITVQTSAEEGGLTFPDFCYVSNVPLCSGRLRDALVKHGAEGVFTKPVLAVCPVTGRQMQYYMVLPSRIDCLDWNRSEHIRRGGDDIAPLYEVRRYVFSAARIGCYPLFKLARVMDNRIFVTEALKSVLEDGGFEGLEFYEAGECL